MTSPAIGTAPTTTVERKPTPGTTSVDRKDQNSKDTFLKLLVAQMRFQDPANPTSSSEFMAQTATFTQVEKLQELATQNAAMLASQRTLTAGAMVGHTVSYTDETGQTKTGTVSSVRIATDSKDAEAVVNGVTVPMGRITDVSVPATTPTPATDKVAVDKAAADKAAAEKTAADKAAADKAAADKVAADKAAAERAAAETAATNGTPSA